MRIVAIIVACALWGGCGGNDLSEVEQIEAQYWRAFKQQQPPPLTTLEMIEKQLAEIDRNTSPPAFRRNQCRD